MPSRTPTTRPSNARIRAASTSQPGWFGSLAATLARSTAPGVWAHYEAEPLTLRQKKVLNRYLDGFDGKLTAKKWAAIGKCSIDEAERDIRDLIDRGLLCLNPGESKRANYELALIAEQARPTGP
jgi:hypothetical protein